MLPRQAGLAWVGLCCLCPGSPGLILHLAFSVPSVSETVLGARGVDLGKTGTLSYMDNHSIC